VAQHAAEQRAPREVDRQLGGGAVEGLRRVLRRRDHEQRVRHATAGSAARGVGHGLGVGVEADEERPWRPPRGGQDSAAVTRTEVDGDAPVVRGQGSVAAVVELFALAVADYVEH